MLDSLGDSGVPMQSRQLNSFAGMFYFPIPRGVPRFHQMRVMHVQMYTHNQWEKKQKENSNEGITCSEMGKQRKMYNLKRFIQFAMTTDCSHLKPTGVAFKIRDPGQSG